MSMMGKPTDVEGECNAHLYIADDFGDNSATMRCQLLKGHSGNHREVFNTREVTVEWAVDERQEEEALDMGEEDADPI